MADTCILGYEVTKTRAGRRRGTVFLNRQAARKFWKTTPGARLRVVKLCDARIVKKGRVSLRITERRRKR